jgi:universal stress protein F
MFKKIVVAIDIAQIEKGRKILKRAADLLDDGGELLLLNVVEDVPGYLAIELPADVIDRNRRSALETLDMLKAEAGVSANTEVRTGPPARSILACAQDNHADLIVVASHRPDMSNYLLGSTADRVVRHAGISVLVDR